MIADNNFIENTINEYFNTIKTVLSQIDYQEIIEVVSQLKNVHKNEGTIYIFGNGGSASTASHFQNDFNRGLAGLTKKNFKVNCLSDNIATITAIANDFSYEEIFYKQLENRLTDKDIVIAISGSGNSENVLKATKYAKEQGNKIIAFTGFDGRKLGRLADFNLHVPIDNMQITEDVHLIFNHLLMTIMSSILGKKE